MRLALFPFFVLFFAAVLSAAEPLKVDFSQNAGSIKPLHGINNSPLTHGQVLPELRDAGIPYCRLHDIFGRFGGGPYVDIPNVFPNFDADPNDPASYDFTFTDAYLKGLTATGMKPIYRLGVTIENYQSLKAYRIFPPKDFEKWAKICEMIIRHYTQGWNDGFHYDMKYWEIWNEPENPQMWKGTREEFFELYRIAANHLKKEFPDLKIGGFASCGFYAVTRPESQKNEFQKSFLLWFDSFLAYVTAPETKAPLDFFSWHLYATDPDEIAVHAAYVEEKLKEHHLEGVESVFDEWNYIEWGKTTYDDMKEMPGAAFVGAAFSLMQESGIDLATYYDAYPARSYCGLYYFPSQKVSRTYYVFYAFNQLFKLGTCVKSQSDHAAGIYAVAAQNASGEAAVLVTNNRKDAAEMPVEFQGCDLSKANVTVKLLDSGHLLEPTDGILADGKLKLPPLSVVLITLSGK